MILASGKINMHFEFYFYFKPIAFEFGAEILHFYIYYCLKINLFAPKLLNIFIFISRSQQQLYRKSLVNQDKKTLALYLDIYYELVNMQSVGETC